MPADDSFRRAHLLWAVQHVLRHTKGRVQTQGQYDALIDGPGPNHILHVVLSLLTMGFWLVIWLAVILLHSKKVYRIAVDEQGALSITDGHVAYGLAPDGSFHYGPPVR